MRDDGTRASLFGVDVDLAEWAHLPTRALLFGEAQGRVIVSTTHPTELVAMAQRMGVPARAIGRVGAQAGTFRIRHSTGVIEAPVADIAAAYHDAIPRIMTQIATAIPAPAGDDAPEE